MAERNLREERWRVSVGVAKAKFPSRGSADESPERLWDLYFGQIQERQCAGVKWRTDLNIMNRSIQNFSINLTSSEISPLLTAH